MSKKIIGKLVFPVATVIPFATVSCLPKEVGNKFRLDMRTVNFKNNGIVQKLSESLKENEFTIIYPDDETLKQEAKKIQDYIFEKGQNKKDFIEKCEETIKWLFDGKDSEGKLIKRNLDEVEINLTKFTNDYLYGRHLIKVEKNFSKDIELDVKIIYFYDNVKTKDGKADGDLKFQYVCKQKGYEDKMDATGATIKFDISDVKGIKPNHNHITESVIKTSSDDLEIMIKYNESTNN